MDLIRTAATERMWKQHQRRRSTVNQQSDHGFDDRSNSIRLSKLAWCRLKLDSQVTFGYIDFDMQPSSTEGPVSLGLNGDIIWFARGRVAVGVPQNMTGGRPEAMVHIRKRYEQIGKPLALAILIKDGSDRPNQETREDIRRTFDEMSPMLACNSITILGSAFFTSFFISIVSRTLGLTLRHGGAYGIHTRLESTAAWMHEQLNDPNISLEEIVETLQWAAREEQALSAASS